MTAITHDRDTPQREHLYFAYPARAGVVFYVGTMIALDSATGFTAPASGAETEIVVGVTLSRLDTTHEKDGDQSVRVRRGCFRFTNDPAGAYTLKDVGKPALALDNATVSKSGKAPAGIVRDVDANGVWIEL